MHSLIPATPARVLVEHTVGSGHQEFFEREGVELLRTVLAFVLMLTDERAPAPEEWLDPEAEADVVAWVRALAARARGEVDGRGANVLALAAWALTGRLTALVPEHRTVSLPADEESASREWLFARAARRARVVWGDAPGEGRDVLDLVTEYWEPMSRIPYQYAGVLATARTACSELADATLARRLYFGCEPGYAAARAAGEVLDFARAVSREGGGPLVLYQPALHGSDALVARALKAAFFEAVLHDPDRARGVRRPAAGRLRGRRVPPLRDQRPGARGAELPRHLPRVRGVLRAGLPVGGGHRARAGRRRGEQHPQRGGGVDADDEHGHQAGLPKHRPEDAAAASRVVPAPPGARRGDAGAPADDARPGRVLRAAARRAVRAAPARALRGVRRAGTGPPGVRRPLLS